MKKLLIAVLATGLLGASGSALAGHPHHSHGKPPGLHDRVDHAKPSPLQRKILQAQHDNRRGYEKNRRHHNKHHSRNRKDHSRSYRGNKHHHHYYHSTPPRHHSYRGSDRGTFGVVDGSRGVLIWRR